MRPGGAARLGVKGRVMRPGWALKAGCAARLGALCAVRRRSRRDVIPGSSGPWTYLARGYVPAGRRDVHPDRSWPAGAWDQSDSGVRAWSKSARPRWLERDVRYGRPSPSRCTRSGDREGSVFPQAARGRVRVRLQAQMGCVEAVQVNGTPFESN